tara:strand:- start:101262 stop:102668 length:1407 start_codon:yes stop_codon:yes gene_type:complete
MSFIKGDTVVAMATAPLAAGVAVIRISGPKAKGIVNELCPSFANAQPRFMHYGKLIDRNSTLLDETLMVYFKAPHSFTGEDVVEINCHGGVAVVDGLLNALMANDGVRHAEAGEFTRRAFMNDKMDLTAAEGVADLVAAETEEQKKQALSQMKGELGVGFERWRSRIIHMLAHSEAAIDFPDEELDVLADAGVKLKVDEIIADLEAAIDTDVGCRLRDGFKVVIIGKPNAGKSSLTNLLTGKDTAIVSAIEGTTRDVIDTRLDVNGYPIILSDTAGIRETQDEIEREGVSRAKRKVDEADLVILVTDGTQWPDVDADLVGLLKVKRSMVIFSKSDKLNQKVNCEAGFVFNNKVELKGEEYPAYSVNLTAADCLPVILNALGELVSSLFAQSQQGARLSRERHREAVRSALVHLYRARDLFEGNDFGLSLSELLAQDLRDAAAAIGTVTGKTDTEDVLDLVFSTFCIGK